MRVSIVIPALNEAASLPATLDAIATHAGDAEVVVVDAGSRDETARVVETHAAGATLVSPGGLLTRGAALNAGARHAGGEVLWFLHADSHPGPGHLAAIRAALARPDVVGGAFEFRLRERDWRLRVVECVNRVRYRIRQRYYGDQGIFVRREAYERVGGFREYGLMEDAHFCRDLRRHGRIVLSRSTLPTSGRRFLRGGVFTVLWFDARIWARDALGRDVQMFSARYRAENIRGKADHDRGSPSDP